MNHELLVFRPQVPYDIPAGRPRPQGSGIHLPDATRQASRIGPQLARLAEAFEQHRVQLQHDIQGLVPESVVVFEVAESVDSFIIAVRRAGMEWMGDWEGMEDADEDFYVDGAREKKVPEKLYFSMTDQRALQQMLSLWDRNQRGEESFPRGMSSFKKIFAQLRSVRLWDYRDRYLETGMEAVWRDALSRHEPTIRFEIELWYRDAEDKRNQAQQMIMRILAGYGGRVLKTSIYPEIAYHGLLVECAAENIARLMERPDNALFSANQIMWIRPTGQALVRSEHSDVVESQLDALAAPSKEPVIALFDGLPLAGHQLLNGRIDINDADGYEEQYPVQSRSHGTQMASIILHGDLNHPMLPLDSRLYVRPILRPAPDGNELIPEDKLFVDVLHQAVMEIVNDPALRSTVRIVNLSIGDLSRPFSFAMSPASKMLDYLGERYHILFVVSAGNEGGMIDLPMTLGDYRQLTEEERYKAVYKYLWEDQAERRILSPSESINSLTVGAQSLDYSAPALGADVVEMIPLGMVSAYSRFGGGLNRSIKPDILNMGGRYCYNMLGTSASDATFRPIRPNLQTGPGIKTAVPTNGLTGAAYSCGTSQATAMTSRLCAEFLNVLRSVPGLNIPSEHEAIAMKAMAVHCCSWQQMGDDMRKYIPVDNRLKRKETLKWIGYGTPKPELSFFCTDQRVTLMGTGKLEPGKQVDLQFPLPPCLISQRTKKRLTITLAWMSPIAPKLKNYRLAKLQFSAKKDLLMNGTAQDSDSRASHRGTVQHEVFEDSAAKAFQQDDLLIITVSCRKEPLLREPIGYALIATLEVAEETGYPIYAEVAARLQNPVQVGM